MKKTALILCCVMVALAIACVPLNGCGQNDKKIAFFIYDGSDTFISEMMDVMTGAMPDNISYEVRDAGNSQVVQNQQIVELIDQGEGYDLFVINAVDRLACNSIVEKCADVGIPVIFFNREPLEDALVAANVYYVGAAADSLGEKQADMIADLFGTADNPYDKNGDGIVQLVILKGEQGHQDAEKRTERCVDRLKELGFATQVLAIEVADWNRTDAYDAMRSLYQQYGDEIEVIFANNDDMALGAIDYLVNCWVFSDKGGPYSQPMVIVGVDATAVGLEAIEAGLLYGTVNNDAQKQSDAILTLADYIINDRDMSDYPYAVTNGHYIYIDGDIITQQNLSS